MNSRQVETFIWRTDFETSAVKDENLFSLHYKIGYPLPLLVLLKCKLLIY